MLNPRRMLLLAASSLALTGMVSLPAYAASSVETVAAQTPAPEGVWAHDTSDIPVDTEVRYGVLPNGMRYAIRKNATPPGQAALRLRIDAGSLMENEEQLGLAHFMEHMAFNGTTNIPKNDLLRILERLGLGFGADTDAFTAMDQTVYMLQLPRTNDETVDTALNIMREQVSEALMSDADINEERGVIEGEQRLRNTPALRSLVTQLGLLAPDQLISKRMPIGDLKIIRSAPRERFVEFYNAYYRPERATFIAVGDFDVDQIEAKIKAQFSSWQGKGENGSDPDLGKVSPREPETKILVEPGTQSSVQLIWIRDPDLRPDSVATRLEAYQTSMGLAILNRRLGELARADNPPFIGASGSSGTIINSLDMGTLAASFNPGGLKRALETIEQEQRRLIQYGVTQAEIDREVLDTRSALETAVKAATTRNTAALAGSILSGVNDDVVITSPEYQLSLFEQAVQLMTVESVNTAFKSAYEGYGPLVMVTTPEAIEGGEEGVTQVLLASQDVPVTANTAQAALEWPYTDFGTPGTVASTRELTPVGATVVTFANDVRLVVKTTDFKKEEILINLRTGTGELEIPKDRFSPTSMASAIFAQGGLGQLTSDQMNRVLTGKFYNLGLSAEPDAYMLSGSTRPSDLELQMQVMAAYLTDPGLRPAPFEMIKGMFPQILSQSMATPSGAFSLKAPSYLANGDRRETLPTLEEISQSTNEEMKQGVIKGLSTGPIEIVMVGDVTVEAATEAVAKTFGAMPARPEKATALPGADQRQFPAPTPEPVVLTHQGLEDQGLAFIAWPTTDSVDDRTSSRRLGLLAAVLQLRVTEEIREKQSIAYAPRVNASSSDYFKDYGTLAITAEIKPENFDAFYAAVDAIIADISANPPSEDELNRARAPMIEAYRRSQAGNAHWLGQLEGLSFDLKDMEQNLNYLSVLESITPAQLQEMAQTYLKPDTAWKAVVRKGE